ncbi:MAG: hypothetical protein PHO07_21475, partial [Pirellulales bacterium]|nr:hypothetical protein [Pirellulales bacterium]
CARRCTPILDIIDGLFGCRKACKTVCSQAVSGCGVGGCGVGGCGVSDCGCDGGAEAAAPVKEAAPLPVAPKADPSASLLRAPRSLEG